MTTTTINTYLEMNEKIVGFLRISDNPCDLYAAQYIEELRAELSRVKADFKAYISDQVKQTAGVYACNYCRHRRSADIWSIGCKHKDCDGISEWEYGEPPKEAEEKT